MKDIIEDIIEENVNHMQRQRRVNGPIFKFARCPHCDGTKRIDVGTGIAHSNPEPTKSVTCDLCDGTGEVEVETALGYALWVSEKYSKNMLAEVEKFSAANTRLFAENEKFRAENDLILTANKSLLDENERLRETERERLRRIGYAVGSGP